VPAEYLEQVKTSLPSDLVSVPEASKVTGIRQRTIWKQIREGRLRAWGPRRCYRISISELLAPVIARGACHE
jgi:excisionase family DNA binding protein